MSRRGALPPPAEADPAEVWAPLDRLVRGTLPAFLESLGFVVEAATLRKLAPIADAAAAEHLRAVRRRLVELMFESNCALAREASRLAAEGADELDVIKARRAVHHPRFERAATLCGLVLGVCASWAGNTGLPPGPWPSPRISAAIALREIRLCEQGMA